MADQSSFIKNEHILEIRYKPNPKVLDFRGSWAKEISSHMELPHWRILQNRIDIFNNNRSIHAFVGFKNGGITLLDTPTKNFFPDKAIKLLRFLFQLDGFGDPIYVERLGLRSKFCAPYNGSFDELLNIYSSNYLTLTNPALDAIGRNARIVDMGGPINFIDDLGNFNTMSGPMPNEQLQQFFTSNEGFPEVGLYFDIDYWVKPSGEEENKRIISQIRDFAYEAWDRFERVRYLLLEE